MSPRSTSSSSPLVSSKENLSGFLYGILAPISFGFMPLFTMPMIYAGMGTASILAYRFAFSALFFFLYMLVRGISLKISRHDLWVVILLGAIYVWSASGVQIGYRYMPTGISTIIHFTYPIWVILIMLLFYRQRPTLLTLFSITLAILGVASLVGLFGSSQDIPLKGFLIVASTGLAYGSYLVIISRSGVNKLHPVKFSFYVMTVTAILFAIIAQSTGGIEQIPGRKEWISTLMLSLVSTVCANLFLILAAKKVSATTNAIFGALEPLTAVVIGILFLSEALTISSIIGIGLILIAVLLIALSGRISSLWRLWITATKKK